MKARVMFLICGLFVGVLSGFLLFYFIQKQINRNVSMANSLASMDEHISPEVRLRDLCAAISSDEEYIPPLILLSRFLMSGDTEEASRQIVDRVSLLIERGEQSPYSSMSKFQRQAEIERIRGGGLLNLQSK